MTKPLIALLSAPRSGTNHVMVVLHEALGVARLGEWFDPRGSTYIPKDLRAKLSQRFDRPIAERFDAELGRWVQADPARSLALLRETLPPRAPAGVFKLFPQQLPDEKVASDILTFPNTLFLVLERNPIDAYISLVKAEQADRWLLHDTTDQRVALDAGAYLDFRDLRRSYFDFIRTELERRHLPWADLRYEKDVLPGPRHLDTRLRVELDRMGLTLRLTLRTRLRFAHGARVDALVRRLGVAMQPRAIGLPRQDRAPRRRDKVSNWDAFADEIAARTGARPDG